MRKRKEEKVADLKKETLRSLLPCPRNPIDLGKGERSRPWSKIYHEHVGQELNQGEQIRVFKVWADETVGLEEGLGKLFVGVMLLEEGAEESVKVLCPRREHVIELSGGTSNFLIRVHKKKFYG